MDKVISDMTDREIAEETLTLLRAGRDAIAAAMENPMLGAMLGGSDPVAMALGSRR